MERQDDENISGRQGGGKSMIEERLKEVLEAHKAYGGMKG